MMPSTKHCFVYLICTDAAGELSGPCKVGISDNPSSRLKQVQTGSPTKLVVAFDFRIWDRSFAQRIEAAFHACYADDRMQGEWFDMPPIEALRGIVDVFKMGLDRLFEGEPNAGELFQQTADASNLMEAALLLHKYYGSQGMLTTQTGAPN